VRAIILAAGRGSRLQAHTDARPKCLTELGGMSLIDRQLAVLRGARVDDIVIATGYRAGMLDLPGTRQVHNPDWETTNMVETLFRTEELFGDDMIVSYSDIVYEPRVLDAVLSSSHDVSVVVDRRWRKYWEHRFADPLSDAESLRLDARGCITEIGNPVTEIDDVQAQYIGLMRFQGSGIAALKRARGNFDAVRRPWMDRRPVSRAYMTDLLMEMVLIGIPVHAIPIDGGWLEIDTVSDFESADAMFADGSITKFFDPATTPAATAHCIRGQASDE
jgi:L-glutamine-phosphate cytidylyltransferase